MAQFPTITLTNAGLNMIAQAQAGEKLIFTKAKMGDGQIVGQNISTLVDLISPKLVLPLGSCESQGTGQVKLRFTATNEAVEAGFFARELGVYAKIGDGGAEQLYAYTNAGNFSDYVPDKNTPLEAQTVNMYVIVGNAQNVAILVDKTVVYITLADMDDHDNNLDAHGATMDKHNDDANAHAAVVAKHNDDDNAHADGIAGNAATATKATQDSDGNKISETYTKKSTFADDVLSALASKTLSSLGVAYSMGSTGYVSFGPLFGGLIIQWGLGYVTGTNTFPVVFTDFCSVVASSEYSHNGTDNNIRSVELSGFIAKGSNTTLVRCWLAVGR